MNFSELGQRFRKNIQTYIIIIALVAIWGVFAIITKGGYFMPQNISNLFRQMTVTGFDGVPDAVGRGLTTVSQPSLQKGRRAGELLLSPPRSGLPVAEVLGTQLIRGRTAGPPA